MSVLQVTADLAVELDLPGRSTVHLSVRGAGQAIEVQVDDPATFAARGDAGTVQAVAATLDDLGLQVRVVSGETHLVTLGAVRTGWWSRRLTGSRHIRIGGVAGLWAAAKARSSARSAVFPDHALAPPPTVIPLLPTLVHRSRRRVTTTHSVHGGGAPRLVLAPRADPWPGDRQPSFRLHRDVTSLGSAEGSAVRLPDLASLHAEVVLEDGDEFYVVARDGDVRVNGERTARQLLRTGSRLQVGPWTMTFYRDEYADHGRPFGGRAGGEIGHQQPQPSRRTSGSGSRPTPPDPETS